SLLPIVRSACSPSRAHGVALATVVALAPFVVCALVRVACWGRPGPLALMAKPSDLTHGVSYAGAGLIVTLVPLLALAPWALRRDRRALTIAVAAVVHLGAIAAVGGDWMPYARLLVPVVPSLAYAAAIAAAHAHPAAVTARSIVAASVGAVLLARGGAAG